MAPATDDSVAVALRTTADPDRDDRGRDGRDRDDRAMDLRVPLAEPEAERL
jgi:hypothetical protein